MWLKQLNPKRNERKFTKTIKRILSGLFGKDSQFQDSRKMGLEERERQVMMGILRKKEVASEALVVRNASMKALCLNRQNQCTIRQSVFAHKKFVQQFQHSRVPISRKTTVFLKKFGNSNQKPTNSPMGVKHRASAFKITKSKFTPTLGKNESRRKELLFVRK